MSSPPKRTKPCSTAAQFPSRLRATWLFLGKTRHPSSPWRSWLGLSHGLGCRKSFGTASKCLHVKIQRIPIDLCPNRYTIPIVDEGRRVVVLCGGADASDWLDVHQSAAAALEDARGRMSWGKKDRRHRRGRFFARNAGISHGGGQTKPMVLRHSPPDDEILSGLLKHPSFVRMAGHASGRQTELLTPILTSPARYICHLGA